MNVIINIDELYIDVESSRPVREWVKAPMPVVVLDNDTPPALRFSYYIFGQLDACQQFIVQHRLFFGRLITE